MLTLLSPAKKQASPPALSQTITRPIFLKETQELRKILQGFDGNTLGALMSISPALAKLNVERFQGFDEAVESPALFAFQGDVYQSLDARSLSKKALDFAQDHLGILSGLYGLLRPFDAMKPHRLEMGTDLESSKGKSLYAFWGNQITTYINAQLEQQDNPVLINLASQEYAKAIQFDQIRSPVIHIEFKEHKNGKYSVVGILAKRARGKMARFILNHQIDNSEKLKQFNEDGYQFNQALSQENVWVFAR